MSPRNFRASSCRETGVTPAKFLERARIERGAASRSRRRACRWSTRWRVTLRPASAERMRRTFRRHLRVVPQDYRRRFERASA